MSLPRTFPEADPAMEDAARAAFEERRRRSMQKLRDRLAARPTERTSMLLGACSDRLERRDDGWYVDAHMRVEWLTFFETWKLACEWRDAGSRA